MTAAPARDSPLAARFVASPNFGERRGGGRPNALILHYTGMPTAEGALKLLVDPASEVSAHYFVQEDGEIVQLVAESARAWHAGTGFWKGETDMNSASIGIEIVNPGHDGGSPPFPDPQIEATIALARDIAARWTIRARAGARPFRHRPDPQARSGRSLSLGRLHAGRRRPLGRAGADLRRPALRATGRKARRFGRCRRCWRSTATGSTHRRLRPPDAGGGDGLPAPLPPRPRRWRAGRLYGGDAEGADRGAGE